MDSEIWTLVAGVCFYLLCIVASPRRIRSSILSVALFLFFGTAIADGLDPYRIKHTTTHLPNSSTRLVQAEAHFPAPADVVWKLLDRTAEYPKYIPRVLVSESQGILRGREQIYIVLDLPWPFSNLWNVISLGRDKGAGRFDWTMVDGNMKENSGSLRIEPEKEGSAVFFEARVDPGIIFPSGWFVSWGTKSYVPKMLRAIAKRLESEKKDKISTPAPTTSPSPTPKVTATSL